MQDAELNRGMQKNSALRFDPTRDLDRIVLWSRSHRLFTIGLLSVLGSVFGLIAPLCQKYFVDQLTDASSVESIVRQLGGGQHLPEWFWLLAAVGAMLISQWLSTASLALGVSEAIARQRELSELVYKKILSLRTDQQGSSTVGESVSLYATDIPGSTAFIDQTLPLGLGVLFPFIVAPWMIHLAIGLPVWHTFAALAALVTISMALSVRQAKFFQRFKELAAKRIGFVNEWVQNIRLLRILGWVQSFEQKIFASRERETINRIKMVTNGQMMGAFGSSVNFVLAIVGIALLIQTKGAKASPGDYFAILWIYGVFLSRPFRQVPWLFTFSFDAWTSIRRLRTFLSRSPDSLNGFESGANKNVRLTDCSLNVRGLSLELEGQTILHDVSFEVGAGELIAIVGPVGSGKSLLLLSLIGETGAEAAQLSVGANDLLRLPKEQRRSFFSYAPQESFVMSATIRENVAFEYQLRKDPEMDGAVTKALHLAQFDLEQEGVRDGLEASIGERGVNLSGGQKQRVTLARTTLLARPILLIDDALSAVDVKTEKVLVDRLLVGEWANSTRLLVTHRFSVLPLVDRVLFMRGGRVVAQGPYQQLMRDCAEFRAHVLGEL